MDEPQILHAGDAEVTRQNNHAKAETSAASPGAPPQRPVAGDIIVDARGRKLKLREDLTFLQEMDLKALAGPERAPNTEWISWVMIAARIDEIDGVAIPFPRNEATLRAMIQRVDRDGVVAIVEKLIPQDDDGLLGSEATAAKN